MGPLLIATELIIFDICASDNLWIMFDIDPTPNPNIIIHH